MIILIGEFKEFGTVFLKKYGVNACVVDKVWRDDLNDYLYCLELDKSITNDPDDLILFSLTYNDICQMMND